MPKIQEHSESEERRRNFILDTMHKIMEIYFLSVIIHQCNIAFRPRPHVAGYFRKRKRFSPNTATIHA